MLEKWNGLKNQSSKIPLSITPCGLSRKWPQKAPRFQSILEIPIHLIIAQGNLRGRRMDDFHFPHGQLMSPVNISHHLFNGF